MLGYAASHTLSETRISIYVSCILHCGQQTMIRKSKKYRKYKTSHSLLFCVLLRMLQAWGVRRMTLSESAAVYA